MIKLFIKLSLFCSFIFDTTFVQAGIIPVDITTITADTAPKNINTIGADSYITYKKNGRTWDIAWASDVNSELYFEGYIYNTLFAANTQTGWTTMPVDESSGQLELFLGWDNSAILELFRVGSSTNFTHAFEYWNSEFISPLNPDPSSYVAPIRSEMILTLDDLKNTSTINYKIDGNNNYEGSTAHTFYFRESTVSVPEPSTLMIFALGLIALASKKRLFS
jgi:hypothetical protein